MENTFITVRTPNCSINAHLNKMKLEAAGIDCILLDEQTDVSSSSWVGVLVNLLVRESDMDSATKVLCVSENAAMNKEDLKKQAYEASSGLRDASSSQV